MGKRIVAILICCLLCIFPLVLVSFADGGSLNLVNSNFSSLTSTTDLDCYLVYTSFDYSENYFQTYSYNSGYVLRVSGNHDLPFDCVVRFSNSSSVSYTINFDSLGSRYSYSINHVTVDPGSVVDVAIHSYGDSGESWIGYISSITSSSYAGFSVFNASALISNVGNMFGFIANNNYLLPLLLIGVTISLGFVSVRFIRKVMWGN